MSLDETIRSLREHAFGNFGRQFWKNGRLLFLRNSECPLFPHSIGLWDPQ